MFSRITITILIYIIVLLLLFYYKPAMMFSNEGNIKNFDYDTELISSSLMSIEVILPIIAVMCYFLVIILELILL